MNRTQDGKTGRQLLATVLSGILLPIALWTLTGLVQAAPVTLQFDAIVGPPRIGSNGPIPPLPPSWNISLQQGDTITGTFTFEPFDAPSNSSVTKIGQPYDFTFHIKAQALTTSQYGMEVYNNSYAVDDGGINPSDNIYIGCFGTPSCIPSAPLTPNSLTWAFHLNGKGYSSVLDGADIPSDPVTWQHLYTLGSLVVSFNDTIAREFYSFSAEPITFRAVPEPGSCFVALCGVALFMTTRRFL